MPQPSNDFNPNRGPRRFDNQRPPQYPQRDQGPGSRPPLHTKPMNVVRAFRNKDAAFDWCEDSSVAKSLGNWRYWFIHCTYFAYDEGWMQIQAIDAPNGIKPPETVPQYPVFVRMFEVSVVHDIYNNRKPTDERADHEEDQEPYNK